MQHKEVFFLQFLKTFHGFSTRFDNMRAPAALLAGAIVPLGFFAAPKIEKEDADWLAAT